MNARRLLIAVLLAGSLLPSPASAKAVRGPRAREYDVKAAFLFHFTEFVSWPVSAFAGPDSALTIGVFGSDPFGTALDEVVAGEVRGGRPLRVVRCASIEDASSCRILFVAADAGDRLPRLLAALRGRPVLTVGESPGFASRGGMIEFAVVGGRIRLRIDPASAQVAGLVISSQLLRQAELVEGAR